MPQVKTIPITPWSGSVRVVSPDGRLIAKIEHAQEFRMSSPTSGLLEITNGVTLERCSPSLVWSDNSEYLAVPQWQEDSTQRLVIVRMCDGEIEYLPGVYSVLELRSFEGGVIEGVNSPAYKAVPFRFDVSALLEERS